MSLKQYLPSVLTQPHTEPVAAQQTADMGSNAAMLAAMSASGAADEGSGSGTYVVKSGDSLSAIAQLGTGDALQYRALNTFNGRDAEDASIEPGDVLKIPAGWDLAATGATPDAAATLPRAAAPAHAAPTPSEGGGLLNAGAELAQGWANKPTPSETPSTRPQTQPVMS